MTGLQVIRGVSAALVLAMVGGYLYFTLSNASYTLGCDYLAYDGALRRLLGGDAVYDLSVTSTGDCGTFQYPPAFLAFLSPMALLPPDAATWTFIGLSIACLVGAVALMPVPFEVRLITLALAGTSWPMLFAIKVGAVGPVLFFLYAVAWRWRDRAGPLATSVVVGTLVKVQPVLLLAWMAASSRWRALAFAIAGLGLVGLIGLLLDARLWFDFLAIVRQLSATALDVHTNVAPASVAFQLGVPASAAQGIGLVHTAAVLALVILAARLLAGDASLLVAIVASQMVSPIMWDHYALVLFLPIAWLLARRQWWALVIAMGLNATFVLLVSSSLYFVAMDLTMIGVCLVGWRQRTQLDAPGSAALAAA